MTKEISKEVRAKVFMLYPGAEVLVSDPFNPNDLPHAERLVGVINDPEEQFVTVFDQHSRRMYYFKESDYKLILSDLSDISDEDANHVCRIVNFSIDIEDLPHGDPKEYFLNRLMRHIYNDELNFSTADFLRSRGYMLPAFGITDLFEAGIAVRKDKEV